MTAGIIDKTYVINLEKRVDRWNKIQDDFKNTDLKLTRWNAVYGKDMDEKSIKELTTTRCYYLCAPSIIGCWLSHAKLWEHIVKNNENNVLVLEDDSYPTERFDNLSQLWKEIPEDWDMVYFGCYGSCEKGILFNLKNNQVISKNVIRPVIPIGTHAYLLSNRGARKLLEHKDLKKISFHLDCTLAATFDKNFRVYAFVPPLVHQIVDSDYSDNQANVHPLISNFAKGVMTSEHHTLDTYMSSHLITLRHLGINITTFVLAAVLISLIIGFIFPKPINHYYLTIVLLFYLFEVALKTQTTRANTKNILFEIFLIIISTQIGYSLKELIFN